MQDGKTLKIGPEELVRPFVLTEMEAVVDKAVEAYKRSTAAMRGSRSKIKKLYHTNENKQVRYVGPTASDILEDYLTSHGLDRCSLLWCDLSRIVIDKAEHGKFDKEALVFVCKINKTPFTH